MNTHLFLPLFLAASVLPGAGAVLSVGVVWHNYGVSGAELRDMGGIPWAEFP